MVVHPPADAREMLRFHHEFAAGQPDELTTCAVLLSTPDGAQVVAFVCCDAGSPEEGERVIAPLRQFDPPVADTIGPVGTPAISSQTRLDSLPVPHSSNLSAEAGGLKRKLRAPFKTWSWHGTRAP